MPRTIFESGSMTIRTFEGCDVAGVSAWPCPRSSSSSHCAGAADRLTEPINDQHRVAITGHLRKIADLQADEGPIEPSFPIHGTLFLEPSALQQGVLRRLLLDLQDPHSSNYHQWLTPEDYARSSFRS